MFRPYPTQLSNQMRICFSNNPYSELSHPSWFGSDPIKNPNPVPNQTTVPGYATLKARARRDLRRAKISSVKCFRPPWSTYILWTNKIMYSPLYLSANYAARAPVILYLGKPQRRSFFSGPTTKSLSPPPFELSGHRNMYMYILLGFP